MGDHFLSPPGVEGSLINTCEKWLKALHYKNVSKSAEAPAPALVEQPAELGSEAVGVSAGLIQQSLDKFHIHQESGHAPILGGYEIDRETVEIHPADTAKDSEPNWAGSPTNPGAGASAHMDTFFSCSAFNNCSTVLIKLPSTPERLRKWSPTLIRNWSYKRSTDLIFSGE